MLMTKRDGIETALVILAVLGTLAICLIVAAVHIGFIASPFTNYDALVLTNKGWGRWQGTQ